MSNKRWAKFVAAGPGTVGGRYLRQFWQPVPLSKNFAAGKAVPEASRQTHVAVAFR